MALRVGDDAHDRAVLLDPLELPIHILRLARPLGRVLRHGLALGLVPVLVGAALHLLAEERGPDRGQT